MSDACNPFDAPEPDIVPDLDGVDLDQLAEWSNACWAAGVNAFTGEPLR